MGSGSSDMNIKFPVSTFTGEVLKRGAQRHSHGSLGQLQRWWIKVHWTGERERDREELELAKGSVCLQKYGNGLINPLPLR